MKVSYNLLMEYADADVSDDEAAEILTNTGLEVEGIDKKADIKKNLEGLIVGRIEEVKKHPNADKLSLTTVNTGNDDPVEIICGATNVKKDQKVVVAPVGSTIHPNDNEPIEITKRKIRGVESNGMICSENEIGVGFNSDGIIELNEQYQPGQQVKEIYDIQEDTVFDIGLTPNRADGASHIGAARDLTAYLKTHYPNYKELSINYPSIEDFTPDTERSEIKINIEDPNACPRYSGLEINHVKVEESPQWLQDILISLDQKPINNIVDITNFVMQELGQPLHAFDKDEIKGNEVSIKKLPEKTKFTTLDGEERSLSSNDLMICNKEDPMCIAGVLGGLQSGVSD
ncbi:MAG: YtpR family tRNA-binding protein, partial [Flavobacteriales bacterium]